jgi:hypothetical protein
VIFHLSKSPVLLQGPPSSFSSEYRDSFPRCKVVGGWSYQALPFGADVTNEWSYTSTSLICLHGVDRNNFYLQTVIDIL